MKVLITTSTFPYRDGDGQARFVLDLAKALSRRHDVSVLAPHTSGSASHEAQDGVSIRRFRYFYPTAFQSLAYGAGMRHNLRESLLARLQVPLFGLAQLFATVRTVRNEEISVINSHWLVPQGLTSALASRLTRVPMVLHVHAADVYMLRSSWIGKVIARFTVKSSAAILADGSHVRDTLDALIGFESGAILRPMGVWVNRFSRGVDSPEAHKFPARYVSFVGRLVEKKGVEFLIRAVADVRADEPDLELVIAGDGPLRHDLEQLAKDLGIDSAVHFLGKTDHHRISSMLRAAEVACVPSIVDSNGETEGMPTVVIEAMAAGARVVGSRVNGIPDVLADTVNGWLVEPEDHASLATGIRAALREPRDGALVDAALETANAHDWDSVAAVYGVVLADAVANS